MADAYKQLVIDFIAKTDKFVTQTTTAANSLTKFSSQAKTLASTLTGGLIGAGVAVSLTRLTGLVTNIINEMDKLTKTAQRFGMSAREFQTLSLAADLAGASVEKITKATDILSRRIGELSLGASQSKITERLFGALGLDAKSLNAMDKMDQLLAISRGLDNIGTQSERAAVMMGLFGKSGAELTLLLKDLAPSLERASKTTASLISDDDLKRIEEANDRMAELKTRWQNFKAQYIIDFTDFYGGRDDFIPAAGVGGSGYSPPEPDTSPLSDLFKGWEDTEGYKQIIAEQEAEAAKLAEVYERAEKRLESMITPAERYKEAIRQINEEFAAGAYGEGGAEKWASALELARVEFERVDPESIARKKAMEEDLRAQEAYAAQMQSLGESYTLANQTPTEKYMSEIMQLNQVLAAGTITQDTYARAVANAKNQLSEASGETQRLSELQAWVNANYESTRTPYEKYLGEMQMLNEAMMAGIGSPDLWNRIAMQAEQSLMGAMGNVADAMPGMFGGAPWMQGPLPMNGFGGSSPPGMSMIYPMGGGASTPHTPGTAGMATASQIAGVLRGGSAGDTGKQQLAELKRTNTFLERIVYENAAGFRL